MNELQEFFQSVAIEKKKVAEEQARIQAREERLKPQVNIELTDLSEFFGICATTRPRPKTLQDAVTPPKPEEQKMHLELESFFNRLSSFENALEEQIAKPKVKEKVEEVIEEKSNTQLLADAMSKYTKGEIPSGHMSPDAHGEFATLFLKCLKGQTLQNCTILRSCYATLKLE